MQQVEELYKTHPELFDYAGLSSAIKNRNYKNIFDYPNKHLFNSFTKRSYIELENNLTTTKYPILFITYFINIQLNETITLKEMKRYSKMIRPLDLENLNDECKRLLSLYATRLQIHRHIN